MPNSSANDWDEGVPIITNPRRLGAGEINNLRKAIRARANKEHGAFVTGDTALGLGGGEHTQGSAKLYRQASAPTLRPDGLTSLDSNDAGRLWLDTDTLWLYAWSGSAWVKITAGTQIFQFRKVDGSLWPPSTSLVQSGLTPGTYIVWVEGTTPAGATGSQTFTTSVTVNGVTETVIIDNAPDGSAPFSIALHITVSGAGTCTLSAATNVSRIMKMHGFLTVAS